MNMSLQKILLIALAVFFSFQIKEVAAQRIDQLPTANSVPSVMREAQRAPLPREQSIAAVVNDDVITTSDVKARMALAMLSSNLPNVQEVREKLYPQILSSLIDEQLQLQEGKRLAITVTNAEINQALEKLSKENDIPGGDIKAYISSKGIPPSTLINQARTALTWTKVAQRSLRPRVDIGDDEIDAVVERMRANAGKEEYLTSEIYLTINQPADEDKVRQFADNLVSQIKSGTPFSAVARQFSQGSSAANGGDIGWIQMGQLQPELDRTLQGMDTGTISKPVRSANGFHILGVRDKRTVSLGDATPSAFTLQQAFHPFAEGIRKQSVLAEAEKIRAAFTTCKDLPTVMAQYPEWQIKDLGNVTLDTAPTWLKAKMTTLDVGQATEPMATDQGALILFVCDRQMKETVNRDAIMNVIGSERMELLARRLLRDLRKSAYLDIRIPSL